MTLRPRTLLAALPLFALIAGCGDTNRQPAADLAAVPDQARQPDLARAVDLQPPPDLAPPADLDFIPDFARPPRDFSDLPDDGGIQPPPPPCNGLGYVGPNGECGMLEMCGNDTFQLDCDGMKCTCMKNMKVTAMYIEMPNSCNQLQQDFKNICGF